MEEQQKSFQLTLPVAIVISAAVIAGAILVTKNPTSPAAAANVNATDTKLSLRSVSADDHILGSPSANVTIVEFADFQCPYCSVIYPTLKSITLGSNGTVAWVYRNFPLDSIHPEARPAAEAAECIAAELGNDAFWKFADVVFSDQKSLGSDFYTKKAASLGANPTEFAQCISQKKYDARINTDETEAVKNGGQGTPFTVVVGKDGTMIPFSGALPADQITAIVKSVESKQK